MRNVPNIKLVDAKSVDLRGVHYLDKFYATYNQLLRVLGEPNGGPSGDGKTTIEWIFLFNDNILGVVYDWKESESPKSHPNDEYEWHIGGKDNRDLWAYDFSYYIERASKDNSINANKNNVRTTLTKLSEVKEWLSRNPKVLHLLENNYYRDLLSEDRDSIIKTIIDNRSWLEENIEDDIDIDVEALRNEPESIDTIIFDNFYVEYDNTLINEVKSITKDDLDVTFSQHLTSYRVECLSDAIGTCDVFKEHKGTVTYGDTVKYHIRSIVFQIPKTSPLFLSDDEVDIEALSKIAEEVIDEGSCGMGLINEDFNGEIALTTDVAFDDDKLNDVTVFITIDNTKAVDAVNISDGYTDKYIEFIAVDEDGDEIFTDEVLHKVIEYVRANGAWKIEKVVYGQLEDGDWELILRDDVWVPQEGTIIPEDRVYQ